MRCLALIGALACTLAFEPVAFAGRWKPPQRLTWYWQLTGPLRHGVAASAYDVDGFSTSAREVTALHRLRGHAICYIDVGTWERWRPDAHRFPVRVLGRSNGWPGERWLDIRRLRVLEPIMRARLGICARKRFDAVEPDNIDGFENPTGFRISARDQLVYDEWIASTAHRLGLAVFQKNDPAQASALQPYFDGVLDEQCNQFRECGSFGVYLRAGKPVLNAEYDRALYPAFCTADARAGIMGALYNLALDGRVYAPCWLRSRGSVSRRAVAFRHGTVHRGGQVEMRSRTSAAAGLALTLGFAAFGGTALAASNSYTSGPLTATFSARTTRPNCKQFDPVTVTARWRGKLTNATAYYQFLYNGQVVHTEQVFYGTRKNPYNRLYHFYGSFYDSTFGPFGALSVGHRLLARAVVQVGRYRAYPGLYITPVYTRGCPAR